MCGKGKGTNGLHWFLLRESCVALLMSLHSRLRVDDNTQPLISVEGFATYCDTCAEDLVPWTPLKAGEWCDLSMLRNKTTVFLFLAHLQRVCMCVYLACVFDGDNCFCAGIL